MSSGAGDTAGQQARFSRLQLDSASTACKHSEQAAAGAAAGVPTQKITPRCPQPLSTHLVDHVLQLRLGGVLAQRPHHRAQLLGGDGALQAHGSSSTSMQQSDGRRGHSNSGGKRGRRRSAAAWAARPTPCTRAGDPSRLPKAAPAAAFKPPELLGQGPAALTSPAAGGGGRGDQQGGPTAGHEHTPGKRRAPHTAPPPIDRRWGRARSPSLSARGGREGSRVSNRPGAAAAASIAKQFYSALLTKEGERLAELRHHLIAQLLRHPGLRPRQVVRDL